MKHVLLLEADRIAARCLVDEFAQVDIRCSVATNAHEAIAAADGQVIDAVVSELSLPGHSGSEFLYEFRTYADWEDVPVFVFSSIQPSVEVRESRDWQLLGITGMLYKPDSSLQDVVSVVKLACGA